MPQAADMPPRQIKVADIPQRQVKEAAVPPRQAVPGQTALPSSERVDFATQIQPILQARCQPCHFPGGKVYSGLPFDRPATIVMLGEKLFTRIKDENQRRAIREFLAQQPASSAEIRRVPTGRERQLASAPGRPMAGS